MHVLRQKTVITRKIHYCSACGRIFEKGSIMVMTTVIFDGIGTWKSCLTCHDLISEHARFFSDDHIVEENCVLDSLKKGQTPEDLLKELNSK